jgi:hypothetical protein
MEKITLRVFLTSMVLCASGVLVGIWFEEKVPEELFKFPATFFVIGFGSFILWATRIVYRFLDK